MLSTLRKIAQRNIFLRKLIGYHIASSGLFDSVIKNYQMSPVWQKRIDDVMRCTDNQFIARVADAGTIRGGRQIMHNGLKIYLGSYYGPEYSRMLLLNKGVHEPQEERVFAKVLEAMPAGATMIEMGAFWSFYSMWFQQAVKSAVNYMVEPDTFNLGHGKRNFRLNKMKGTFVQAFAGRFSNNDQPVPAICIDDLVQKYSIPFVDMLHSDIQGFEYDMLQGAAGCFDQKKIGYVFVSTHSNEIHYQCLEFLKQRNFIILASADLDETYSEDGLIAARAPYYKGIEPMSIDKRINRH